VQHVQRRAAVTQRDLEILEALLDGHPERPTASVHGPGARHLRRHDPQHDAARGARRLVAVRAPVAHVEAVGEHSAARRQLGQQLGPQLQVHLGHEVQGDDGGAGEARLEHVAGAKRHQLAIQLHAVSHGAAQSGGDDDAAVAGAEIYETVSGAGFRHLQLQLYVLPGGIRVGVAQLGRCCRDGGQRTRQGGREQAGDRSQDGSVGDSALASIPDTGRVIRAGVRAAWHRPVPRRSRRPLTCGRQALCCSATFH